MLATKKEALPAKVTVPSCVPAPCVGHFLQVLERNQLGGKIATEMEVCLSCVNNVIC